MPGQYRRPVSTSHTSNQRDIEDYPSPYVLRFGVHHIMCRCVMLFHAAIVDDSAYIVHLQGVTSLPNAGHALGMLDHLSDSHT